MSMFFWYLVKNDLSSVRVYKVPEKHGHVYLVGLYLIQPNNCLGKVTTIMNDMTDEDKQLMMMNKAKRAKVLGN